VSESEPTTRVRCNVCSTTQKRDEGKKRQQILLKENNRKMVQSNKKVTFDKTNKLNKMREIVKTTNDLQTVWDSAKSKPNKI
jgi:hypothetical protein